MKKLKIANLRGVTDFGGNDLLPMWPHYQYLNGQVLYRSLRSPTIGRRITSAEGVHIILDDPWDLVKITGEGASII
eukprot:2589202-Prorocentrum_lima.AAC.1